jgi:hypothetical protein
MKSNTQKREEAAERQARYDELSLPEKIELARERGGANSREHKRLKRLLEEQRSAE